MNNVLLFSVLTNLSFCRILNEKKTEFDPGQPSTLIAKLNRFVREAMPCVQESVMYKVLPKLGGTVNKDRYR